MTNVNLDEDDEALLQRLTRNVESNLDSFQQRSAWETANSFGTSNASLPKSSTILNDNDLDRTTQVSMPSTVVRASKTLNQYQKSSDTNSASLQNWPSPLSGIPSHDHNIRLIGDTTNAFESQTPSRHGADKNRTINDTSFLRPDSIRSSSVLRLSDVLSQNILLHPFIALRRTCQVNRKCSALICVQPFSLIPFLYHQQNKQGIAALYKGLSSELLIKGLALGTETVLSNYTGWPREVASGLYSKSTAKVFAVKAMSYAICTPFICSSVIETVQSVIVVKDRPAFIDCIKEGTLRLLHLTSSPTSRILPIWLLIVPTVTYFMARATIYNISKSVIEFANMHILPRRQTLREQQYGASAWPDNSLGNECGQATLDMDGLEYDSNEVSTSILANFVTDVGLLPLETVLYSMYIQGTRTIIDNCDETTVVLPVLTNYDGFADCYQSIVRMEGNLGLFKGLGAIVLQYSMHYLIYRSLYYILRELQSKGGGTRHFSGDRTRTSVNCPPQSISTQPQATKRLANNATYLHLDPNRHSTPNNPADFGARYNRHDRVDGGTPRRPNAT